MDFGDGVVPQSSRSEGLRPPSSRVPAVAAGVGLILTWVAGLIPQLDSIGATTPVARVATVAVCVVLALIYDSQSRRTRLERLRLVRPTPLCEVNRAVLGAQASRLAEEVSDDGMAGYVERDIDKALRSDLETKRVVILVGPSGSGKSRTAFEVAHQVDHDRRVLVPKRVLAGPDRPLSEILLLTMSPRFACRPYWLWVDELGQHLDKDPVDIALLNRWLDKHPDRRLVATLSATDHDRFVKQGDEAGYAARQLLELARIHELSETWSDTEQLRARAIYPKMVSKTLSLYLSSGVRQRRAFRLASENCPGGYALLLAAGDWRRAGLVSPTPQRWLRQAFSLYGRRRWPQGTSDDAIFGSSLRWATSREGALEPVLSEEPADSGCYAPAQIVIEEVQRRNVLIPTEVWRLLLEEVKDPAEVYAVGQAAFVHGRYDIARDALLPRVLENQAVAPELQARARGILRAIRTAEQAYGDEPRGPVQVHEIPTAGLLPKDALARIGSSRRNRFFAFAHRRPRRRALARIVLLVGLDVVGLWGTLVVADLITQGTLLPSPPDAIHRANELLPYLALLVVLMFGRSGLYWRGQRRGHFARVLAGLTQAAIALMALRLLVGPRIGSPEFIAAGFAIACVVLGGLRAMFNRASRWTFRRAVGGARRVALLGRPPGVQEIADVFPEEGDDKVVGYVSTDHAADAAPIALPRLGVLGELDELISKHELNLLILCDDTVREAVATGLAELAWHHNVQLRALGAGRNFLVAVSRYVPGEPLPLDEWRLPALDGAQAALKRTFDVVVAGTFMVLLIPFYCAVVAAIKLTSRGPVLQEISQPGRRGDPFGMRKFRTARITDSGAGQGPLTRPGKFLKRFALDELPQLHNVLRGEMSLVGPRPISASDYERLEEWMRRRYLMLPGMTGLWQISGRRDSDFTDMVRLDLFYAQRWSLFLDVEILLKSIPAAVWNRRATLRVPPSNPECALTRRERTTERRAPFADAVLRALPVSDGLTFDEIATLALANDGDAGGALAWMSSLVHLGWLDEMREPPGTRSAEDAGRVSFHLNERAHAYLANDPRERARTPA